MTSTTIQTGDLTAVVGDNSADGDHRAGYNGLWSLRHSACRRDLFVPGVAGLNHEHIFDGHTDDMAAEIFYEPRHAPTSLQIRDRNTAELHQPPTPVFKLESWTRFTLAAPHYVDMQYRCVPTQHVFRGGYIGLFWASYINAPGDKSIYFLGGGDGERDHWVQLCTQLHNDESTVRHREDAFDLTFREQNRPSLFRSLSPLRFDVPVYYGLFENLVWILMFDISAGIRFTHSPSGGGYNRERNSANPAWDFQFIVPQYEVMKQYGFRARGVLRPHCSREDILAEYRAWKPER
jgi:hypothetical protein